MINWKSTSIRTCLNKMPSMRKQYHTFRKNQRPSIDYRPLSWYNTCNDPWKGAFDLPDQVNKTPCCLGLLAHVWVGRGEPHFYSPEKFEFLRAFLRLGDILTSIYTLRHNRHFNHSPIQWQRQSKGGLIMDINYSSMKRYTPWKGLPQASSV